MRKSHAEKFFLLVYERRNKIIELGKEIGGNEVEM